MTRVYTGNWKGFKMATPRLNSLSALLQAYEGGVIPGYQVKDIRIPLSTAGEWVYLDAPIECDATDLIWIPYTFGRSSEVFEYALNDRGQADGGDWIRCQFVPIQELIKVDIKNFPFYRLHVRHSCVAKAQDDFYFRMRCIILNDPRVTWGLRRGK